VDARAALPMWDPEICPHVLRLVAFGPERPLADVLGVSLRPSRTARTEDGAYCVAYGEGDHSLQVRLRWQRVRASASLLAELPGPESSAWLNAIARFSRLRATGRIDDRVPQDPRGPRLSMVLRALDASLAGASHREIAAMLVGPERVERDWRHPGQHLRDRIRRAVRRGQALMTGGYRELLR
jgi:hypothetical protein